MRRFLTLLLAALACGALLGAGAYGGTTRLGTLRVSLVGQDHHPIVGKTWRYKVQVTDLAGKPVACKIHLQMLFAGLTVVGEVGTHVVKNGVWKETIVAKGPDAFPPSARGQPLTLQATVTAKGYATAKARWKIVVK